MDPIKTPETTIQPQQPIEAVKPQTPQAEESIAPQPPQMPEVPVVPKSNNSVLITAVVLLFLTVLGAGGYLAYKYYQSTPLASPKPSAEAGTPTADLTANWKTYTKENAYSIRYPQNWFLIDDLATVYIGPNTDAAKSTDNYIVISTSLPGAFGTPEELKKQGYTVEETKIIVAGKEIPRLYLTNPANTPKLDYKQLVQVEIPYTGAAWDFRTSNTQLFDEFDQILSTFKFLDENGEISEAAKKALVQYLGKQPDGKVETDIKTSGDWAFGNISVTPDVYLFLARKISNNWQIAIQKTTNFNIWLKDAPDTLLSPEAKKSLAL